MTGLTEVIDLLKLTRVEPDTFCGGHPAARPPRAFGGQVMAQALQAGGRTVPTGRLPHSLHGYFVRPGTTTRPTVFRVTRLRDGGSLSVRRITASQGDDVIFEMTASFIDAKGPPVSQAREIQVPGPSRLPTIQERLRAYADELDGWWVRERPFDIRPVGPPPRAALDEPGTPDSRQNSMWLRAEGVVPDDALLQMCLLAYASDLTLLEPTLLAHRRTTLGPGSVASLDHAMWFHRVPVLDHWLLYEADLLGEAPCRGLNGGRLLSREGELVATVAQEGYLTAHEPRDWVGPRLDGSVVAPTD